MLQTGLKADEAFNTAFELAVDQGLQAPLSCLHCLAFDIDGGQPGIEVPLQAGVGYLHLGILDGDRVAMLCQEVGDIHRRGQGTFFIHRRQRLRWWRRGWWLRRVQRMTVSLADR